MEAVPMPLPPPTPYPGMPSQGTPLPFKPEVNVTDILRKVEKRIHKEEDFYAWLLDQARTLHSYNVVDLRIDWIDLAEELEGMARNEEHGLRSYIEVLLIHLLKWKYQPERRDRSWEVSVTRARSEISARLEDSPSLKTKLKTLTDKAYQAACRIAGLEMGWETHKSKTTFPTVCPWSDSQIMDEEFFPAGCAS